MKFIDKIRKITRESKNYYEKEAQLQWRILKNYICSAAQEGKHKIKLYNYVNHNPKEVDKILRKIVKAEGFRYIRQGDFQIISW